MLDINIHNVTAIKFTRKSGARDPSVQWYAVEITHKGLDGIETADFTLFVDDGFPRVQFEDDRPAKLEAV